jgi:hypothetical protein
MCGRLRCCLIYEYETYAELRKGLPKRGKPIKTPAGEGKVLDVSPLQGTVRVEIPEVGVREFTRAELSGSPEPVFTEVEEPDLDDAEDGINLPTSLPQSPPRFNRPADAAEPKSGNPPRHNPQPGKRKHGSRRY